MKTKLYLLIAAILGVALLVNIFTKPKEIIVPSEVVRVDTLIVDAGVNKVDRGTYESMQDELTKQIKQLQNKLNIRTKDLNAATRVIADLKAQGYGRIDTVTFIKTDTVHVVDYIELSYEDEFTNIDVSGHVSKPDSIKFDFSTSSNFTVVEHIAYKQGKSKFCNWWNKVFKIGKHEVITIESDNPALEVQEIKHIKINK